MTSLLLAFLMCVGSPPAERAVVFRGATVLTAGPAGEIADAVIVVRDGKIAAVGPRGQVEVPEDAEVIEAGGRVIIPGLVDTHSHIGIYPRPEAPAHADGNESTGPAQPGLRALDAIWPGDPGIRMARAGGVTTVNIMPGSGNVMGGQTLYVKLRSRADTIADMMIEPGRPTGGLKMANGENPKRAYGGRGQAPATRMKLAALQREQFVKAQDYRRKWQAYREAVEKAGEAAEKGDAKKPTEPDRDLALESLVEVLERKRTVHFHSHRADDIMTVCRLADEFGFEVVLQHGTEAYKVAPELAKRKIPVSTTIPDSPGGKPEVLDLIEQNAARLEAAGVLVAVNTDDSITESRFLLRTAALTMRGGLSESSALRAVTINPARMLHLEGRIGSIESGKDADLVVLSGRPFRVTTQVLQTYIEGRKVYDRATDGNLAIGGFSVEDPDRRPRPAEPVEPLDLPERPEGPTGLGDDQRDAPRLAVRAGLLMTAAGEPIRDGVVLIEGGRIRAVGPQDRVEVPAGTPLLTARAVTPGFIDAHSVVGVSGRLNVPADQDQDEPSDANQADLRILDSFNPSEPLLAFALRHGVTVIQAFPGRTNVIAGQAGIFRTHGQTVSEMTIRFPSAMVFNLGESPKGAQPGKPPATRMATAALVRNALVAAANHRRKQGQAKPESPPERNLKAEALGLLLDRRIPAIFSAQRADDLETALRLAEEFRLDARLDLAADAYLIRDRIAAAKVPVLVHPTMQRIGPLESYRGTLNNAALLADESIPIAITSAFEDYVPKTRVPLYEAAIAAVNGLGRERALRAITLGPATILGIERDHGSLEPGKVADLVLFDGDPFEYTTHATHVILRGKVVYDRAQQAEQPIPAGVADDPGGDCCDF